MQLNLVWILPTFSRMASKNVGWAWRVAGETRDHNCRTPSLTWI